MRIFAAAMALVLCHPFSALADDDNRGRLAQGSPAEWFEWGRELGKGQYVGLQAVVSMVDMYLQQEQIERYNQAVLQQYIAQQRYLEELARQEALEAARKEALREEILRITARAKEIVRIRGFAINYVKALSYLANTDRRWAEMLRDGGLKPRYSFEELLTADIGIGLCQTFLKQADPGQDRTMQDLVSTALRTTTEYQHGYERFRRNRGWLFGTVRWRKIFSAVIWPLEGYFVRADYVKARRMADQTVDQLCDFVRANPNEFTPEELAVYQGG